MKPQPCRRCGKPDAPEQYSFGVYAGCWCDGACWKSSGYRDAVDENETFDPMDAGEALEPEDY